MTSCAPPCLLLPLFHISHLNDAPETEVGGSDLYRQHTDTEGCNLRCECADGGPGYGNWLLLIMLWIIRTSDGPCTVNQEQTIQVAVSSHSISPLFQTMFFVEQQAFALLFSPGFLLFFISVWNLYDSQPLQANTVILVKLLMLFNGNT